MATDFERHQEALMQQLGGELPSEQEIPTIEIMQRASGIDDTDLLYDLIQLGLRPESLTLMSVAPLVCVAWADGQVHPNEREAVLRVAQSKGITEATPPYRLLEQWLTEQPSDRLMETWEAFVKVIIAKWPEDKAVKFREQLGGLARLVAASAGGVMGIGAVSTAEEALILRVSNAFDLSWR